MPNENATPGPAGEVYDRAVDADGTLTIPTGEAGKRVAVLDRERGMVLSYPQVTQDGTVAVGTEHAREVVQVVVPSDEQFERHGTGGPR